MSRVRLSPALALFLLGCPIAAWADDNDDFFERHNATLAGEEARFTKKFTFDSTTDLTLYLAAAGNSNVFFADEESYMTFVNDGFEGEFGVFASISTNVGATSFVVPEGTYYLVVNSFQEERFTYSVELEKHPFGLDGRVFRGALGRVAEVLQPGEVTGVGFATNDRTTSRIEGCNTGVGIYVVHEDQVDNINNARAFTYLTQYSSKDDPDAPGTQSLHPPEGTYFVIARNNSNQPQAVTFNIYAYQGKSNFDKGGGATAVEQPSAPALGFRFAVPAGGPWLYDEDFGFFALVSDGWLYHDDSKSFYWSGAFGNFDSDAGLWLYQWKGRKWVWLRRDFYPAAYDRDADDFFPL